MKRLVVMIMILFIGMGCSKKETETAGTESQTPAAGSETEIAQEDAGEPREMIPDVGKTLPDAKIKPYFDEKGTITEKSVSTGESFDVYVIAEFEENEEMTAAEYKLLLPEGVSIFRSVETDSMIMRSGRPEMGFMLAFHCSGGPKFMLMKYSCLVSENFSGGTIATQPSDKSGFIGLVDCQKTPYPLKIPAETGEAVLKKK